jgi:hypothetical protein
VYSLSGLNFSPVMSGDLNCVLLWCLMTCNVWQTWLGYLNDFL